MGNELSIDVKALAKGNLMSEAKKYVKMRRLKSAFDKVANRVEFIEELDRLKKDILEVQDFLKKEIKQIEDGKFPQDKLEEDVVAKIKGYSPFDWGALVRKWDSRD